MEATRPKKKSVASKQIVLRSEVPKLTPIDRKTEPKDVQKSVGPQLGRGVAYQAGVRVLNELR